MVLDDQLSAVHDDSTPLTRLFALQGLASRGVCALHGFAITVEIP